MKHISCIFLFLSIILNLNAQNYGYVDIIGSDTSFSINLLPHTSIPINVSYDDVVELLISSDTLTIIPNFIFNFRNVKALEITVPLLKELPKEIEQFKKLEYLGCGCSLKKGVNFDISKLDSLKEVAIINTKFKKIPKKLFKPSNIDFLILSIPNVKKMRFPNNNSIKGIRFYNSENQKIHKSICNLTLERGFSFYDKIKKLPKCVDRSKVDLYDER